MAEKLDAFPQTAERTVYPLDEWLDGSPWKLVKGEDFEHSMQSMRSLLSGGAKARGMKLRTRSRTEEDKEALVVQAYPPEEVEEASRSRSRRSSRASEESG